MPSNLHLRIRTFSAILVVLALFLVYLIIFTPLNAWLTLPLTADEPVRQADGIIVLGGGLRRDGMLGQIGRERVLQGAMLWADEYAPTILMSGGLVQGTTYYEAEEMAAFAAGLGVPYEQVYIEKQSTSTEENARLSKPLIIHAGWESALLVTSAYHTRRACQVFRKQRIPVTCIAADRDIIPRVSPLDRLSEFKNIIREYGATLYYTYKGYI